MSKDDETARSERLRALAALDPTDLHRILRARFLESIVMFEIMLNKVIIEYFYREEPLGRIMHEHIINRLSLDVRLQIVADAAGDSCLWDIEMPNGHWTGEVRDTFINDAREIIKIRNRIAHEIIAIFPDPDEDALTLTAKGGYKLPTLEEMKGAQELTDTLIRYLMVVSARCVKLAFSTP